MTLTVWKKQKSHIESQIKVLTLTSLNDLRLKTAFLQTVHATEWL
jgi:hypothetical protein